MHSDLISLLQQNNLLTKDQVQRYLGHSDTSEKNTLSHLVALGFFSHQELTAHLSQIFSLPVVEPEDFDYSPICEKLGLRELITRHLALPIEQTSQHLTLAISNPSSSQIEDDFRFASNQRIQLALAEHPKISQAIRKLYGNSIEEELASGKDISVDNLSKLVELSDSEQDIAEDLSLDQSPVSLFIHQTLLDAIRKQASDIHFEPYETDYRIRLRCDGILIEYKKPAKALSGRLSARLKVLAKLDISERRLPQDGRIKIKLSYSSFVDLRVSTLPTLWGEKVVLRILDQRNVDLEFGQLGFAQQQEELYRKSLDKPQGLILITGPTGSGKTVSLYTGLKHLNTPKRNIATAEDPIEINIDGINQVQINPKIGFDFAQALRAFLRQDPDVVMVGEIRDKETASIAVKASQTGHLVLSTLHANSATEATARLKHLGIDGFNQASSVTLVIAQRLFRKLCKKCKQPAKLPPEIRARLELQSSDRIFQSSVSGCPNCSYGYSGRTGMFELLPIDDILAGFVHQEMSPQQLKYEATKRGMTTLREVAIDKLKEGITSYDELQRVLEL